VRQPGEPYAEHGIPRRITYLIDPQGKIRKAYNAEAKGVDLSAHAEQVLADIKR
jgi:peroxiredoxin